MSILLLIIINLLGFYDNWLCHCHQSARTVPQASGICTRTGTTAARSTTASTATSSRSTALRWAASTSTPPPSSARWWPAAATTASSRTSTSSAFRDKMLTCGSFSLYSWHGVVCCREHAASLQMGLVWLAINGYLPVLKLGDLVWLGVFTSLSSSLVT